MRLSRNKRFITEFQHLQHFSRESSKLATDSFSFREERISKFRKIVHRKSSTVSRQFPSINRSSLRTDKINPKGAKFEESQTSFLLLKIRKFQRSLETLNSLDSINYSNPLNFGITNSFKNIKFSKFQKKFIPSNLESKNCATPSSYYSNERHHCLQDICFLSKTRMATKKRNFPLSFPFPLARCS